MLEIGCAWSKGSGERLQGLHGPLVLLFQFSLTQFTLHQFRNKFLQLILILRFCFQGTIPIIVPKLAIEQSRI